MDGGEGVRRCGGGGAKGDDEVRVRCLQHRGDDWKRRARAQHSPSLRLLRRRLLGRHAASWRWLML